MSKRLLRDQQGNVAVIFGLCLPLLGLGMGIAVDYSNSTRQQAELQNAADSAALAGARRLGRSEGKENERENLATATAKDFLATARKEALNPNVVSSLDDGTVSVQVSVESPQYFSAFIGQDTQAITVAAQAAYSIKEPNGCFIALSKSAPVGIDLQGSPKLSAPLCGIWSNSDSATSIRTQGSSKISGNKICAVGGAPSRGRGLTPPPESGCKSQEDPYAGRLPEPLSGCNATNYVAKRGEHLTYGTYCGGLDISNVTVTLGPGVYHVVGGPLRIRGNGSLSGAGVTIVLSGAGAHLDMQGNPDITLTAPVSGPTAGIALAMADDGFSKTASIHGNPTIRLAGSLYFPTSPLDLQGSAEIILSGAKDKFVAHSFRMQGSPDIVVAADERNTATADSVEVRLVK
jgi:Flp pilus assembly protein TadG